MTEAAAVYPSLDQRPIKNTICIFDVDETLSKARCHATTEMLTLLSRLRQKVAIAYVGGSDLSKQQEQLGSASIPVTSLFDFSFSENGLTAFKGSSPLTTPSFIFWIGEKNYKTLVNWCLHYIAYLEVPVKRGTFIEYRNGLINISPVGRNASKAERDAFEAFDKEHKVRELMIARMKERFSGLPMTYSIGGQISFDVFPTGWDKTYCLRHLEKEGKQPGGVKYTTIHFFGDKTFPGGNDYEIFKDPRTIGHSVVDPDDTMKQVRELFEL